MKEVGLILITIYTTVKLCAHTSTHAHTLETKAFRSLCMFINEAIINILEIIKSLCVGPVSEFLNHVNIKD